LRRPLRMLLNGLLVHSMQHTLTTNAMELV
jgi:hypothetical protein